MGNKTAEKLKKLSASDVNDIFPSNKNEKFSKTLRHLEKNFLKTSHEKAENDGSFSVIECSSPFEEAEAAAAKITALAKKGVRYREISVVVRNTEDYKGVIDPVFSKYDIPFYFADKDSASEKSLCMLISAVFDIVSSDFSAASIKKYLRSGFSVLSVTECDALISYIETWKIRSHKRYAEPEWAMNPDGYKKELSKHKLLDFNTLRCTFQKFNF